MTTNTSALDNRNVVMFRNSSSGSAVATTYTWYSGGERVDSDIIFWDGAYQFFTGTTGCSMGAYIEDIATHELGHTLGLGHSSPDHRDDVCDVFVLFAEHAVADIR